MGKAESLRRYRGKRDFGATSEPSGGTGDLEAREGQGHGWQGSAGGGQASYVVQIHDASTMHFDFRLEVDGVLKSWAVPKGPSTDPGDKRLAVPTEDHPLEYREYEGVIGRGQYGAGTVIVWDAGTYRPLNKDGAPGDEASFAKALAKGHASFWLDGPKLKGGFSLTRFRGGGGTGRENDGEEAWLLVKRSGTGADRSGRTTPDPRRARSARSGRTLRQVSQGAGTGGGKGTTTS
ncbi:DNA polymerase ligase N-terminal domain-containing protein [Streptomyces sp. NRRL F-5126]|uniref:DNA polymerase ligase N-terminal domain-containing protein n=1 Tax=Streptomyces sp. NRRL F-5126 TaxID=1463857 RepID=UPI0004CBE6FC|nr:DNA polymerase ligase N-terminal domain-containing protein [Streptomyces sp. NRRL F-5126]